MFKRILMFIAALVVFTAASANAAGVQTKIPNMPKISRGNQTMEIPVTLEATLVAKMAVNPMTEEVVEFPAELFPDVSMYSSGYQIYVSLSGPFPPADSGIQFDHKMEVNAGVNGGGFAWVKTIPVGQESAQDRWWFDTTAPSRFDVTREIGGILVAGIHNFRIKVPYTANGGGITLIYDFQYQVGDLVFWTMACQSSDGRVGLELFIKTLFDVVVGETYVGVRVDGWSNGYGTLDVTEYSSDEWPLYSIVPLASSPEYEHEIFGTQRDITLNILGREVTVAQEFFAPYDFLPVCETGGGKG